MMYIVIFENYDYVLKKITIKEWVRMQFEGTYNLIAYHSLNEDDARKRLERIRKNVGYDKTGE